MLPDRKKLREFPVRNPKADFLSDIVDSGVSSKIIINCTVESIARKSVLCLWYFNVEQRTYTHRTFIFMEQSTKEFDYITQQIKPCKWLKSNLCALPFLYTGYFEKKYFVFNLNIIKNYLGENVPDSHPLSTIDLHIQDKRETDSAAKAKEKQKAVDKAMAKFPPLSKNYMKWVEKKGFLNVCVAVKGRGKNMTCSKCNQTFSSKNPVYVNDEVICPHCNSHLQVKKQKSANQNVGCFHKLNGQYLYRVCNVELNFKTGEFSYYEWYRAIIDRNSNITEYIYDTKQCFNGMFWQQKPIPKRSFYYKPEFFWDYGYLYTGNLSQKYFEDSALENLGIETTSFDFVDTIEYIRKSTKIPKLELFYKLHMYRFVFNLAPYELKKLNLDETMPHKICGLSKSQFRYARENNLSYCEFDELRLINQNNKVGFEEFKLLNEKNFSSACNFRKLITTINQIPASFNKCYKYLCKLRAYLISDWMDYIKWVTVLKYKLTDTVLFPKDFKKSHDEVLKVYQAEKKSDTGVFSKAIAALYKNEYCNYETTIGEYCFVIPQNVSDLINEGSTLHHCVSTYVEEVAEKNSLIVFVRKQARLDKPFFTLELNPSTFQRRQLRGNNNCSAPEAIEDAINKYTEYLTSLKTA